MAAPGGPVDGKYTVKAPPAATVARRIPNHGSLWARQALDSKHEYVYTINMAYLRVLEKGSGKRYFYIMRSVRKGDKVIPKVCEYLGRDPDPKRLAKACRYWGVKAKARKGKGR